MTTLNMDKLNRKSQKMQEDAQERWGEIRENTLDTWTNKRNQLVEMVQERFGYTKKEANEQMERFLEAYEDRKEAVAASVDEAQQWTEAHPKRTAVTLAAVTSFVAAVLLYFFKRKSSS